MAAGSLTIDKYDAYYADIGNYCLINEDIHDVHFVVGEEKKTIGAIRSHLINQSRVWWSMLSSESALCEVKNILIPDIDPEVFTLMLRHCYGGLPTCKDLSEETAIKLCYCANKYQMPTLMTKIETRLKPSTVGQVFAAIHCFVNYNLFGVEEAVQQIISTQAQTVIDSPMFLELDDESLTYICQNKLNCTELNLWLAVVKWAKHQDDEGGEKRSVRDWILKPLKHIRLLTLGRDNLFAYVFTEEILTTKEIACLCKGNVIGIPTLCELNTPRMEPGNAQKAYYGY